jgi:hypothetical protein
MYSADGPSAPGSRAGCSTPSKSKNKTLRRVPTLAPVRTKEAERTTWASGWPRRFQPCAPDASLQPELALLSHQLVTLRALAGQLAACPRLLDQTGTRLAPLRHKFVPVLALPGHFDDRLRSLAELGIRPALRGALPLPRFTREQARNLRLPLRCGIDRATPTSGTAHAPGEHGRSQSRRLTVARLCNVGTRRLARGRRHVLDASLRVPTHAMPPQGASLPRRGMPFGKG